MTKQTLSHGRRLFDASVNVETLLWVPGMQAHAPEAFEDFVNDGWMEDSVEFHATVPWLKALLKNWADNDMELEPTEIAQEFWRRGFNGFIVQLRTPVPHTFMKGGGYMCSWGYTQLRWYYVNTMEELVDLCEKFQKELEESQRAKEKKEA